MALPIAVALVSLLLQADPVADEAQFRQAVITDPADVGAHFNLALALSMQHKDEQAIPELRRVLELQPGLFEAQLNLSVLLLRNHRAAEALPLLEAAVQSKPQNTRAVQLYAQALLETGDLPNAEKQFRAASDRPGLLQVAGALEKKGDTAAALGIYREFPDDAAVRAHLDELSRNARLAAADQFRDSKQPEKALEEIKAVLATSPNDFALRMSYARLLRDQRKLIPAAQEFLACTKLRPDSVPAWNELASVLIIAERYPEGLAALDHVRALGKELPGDFYLRAITLDKLKMKPQAIAAYQQFLSADKGEHPDQEFLARQRVRIIESETKR